MPRIGDKRTEVTLTVKVNLTICYDNCGNCQAETPEPTSDMLLQCARSRAVVHATHNNDLENIGAYVWPGGSEGMQADGALPAGWTRHQGGLLCPDCTQVMEQALAGRRQPRKASK
jgi:hypothetical protein